MARELARQYPEDARFMAIPALVVDVADARVAAARLAENINRAALNPLEIAEGVADALENGMTEKELAESLGWQERNVYRYRQFQEAPAWLKAFATQVPVASKKVDAHGAPVLDDVTEAQVHTVTKAPGLELTHLLELLRLYNVLHDADEIDLHENGGDNFKPRAERSVKKLARRAAQEAWSIAKLRAEIKRTKDPTPRTPASAKAVPCVITTERVAIDFRRMSGDDREKLAGQLSEVLLAKGYAARITRNQSA